MILNIIMRIIYDIHSNMSRFNANINAYEVNDKIAYILFELKY